MSTFAGGKDEIREADAWATLFFVQDYTRNVIDR